jgi:cytochrome c553
MNRAFSLFVKSSIVAMLAVASIAHAAEQQVAPKPDVAKGKTLFNTGDSAHNVPACIACHGPAGASSVAQYPKLAAQHESYIYKQLNDFKTAQRTNPVMSPIAKALSDADMHNVAAYLSQTAAAPGAAKNKNTVELGKDIFRGGMAERNIPACAGCHGPSGDGIPGSFPRIAGQHQEYTTAQLMAFRSGARKNSDPMETIAKRMTDDEINAVADYVAGLK